MREGDGVALAGLSLGLQECDGVELVGLSELFEEM